MTGLVIEKTPVWLEIKDIIDQPADKCKEDIRVMLHTVKEDIAILHLRTEQLQADYIENYHHEQFIEFEMLLGEYIYRLYPNRGNMEISIKRIQLNETGNTKNKKGITTTERFKAVFLAKQNMTPSATEIDALSIETLNLKSPVTVKLQLLSASIEPLRVKMVRGIFRNVKPEDLLTSLLYTESKQIKLNDKPIVDAIDIVTPDNDRVRAHYILPDDLFLVDLTNYIQDVEGGIYSNGVGTYFQTWNDQKTWFVYPLYDTTRFEGSEENIIFYGLPKSRFPGLDRTYQTKGKTTKVLITSDISYKDSGEAGFMNQGTGVRFAEARSFMAKPIDISGERSFADRSKLTNEVGLLTREDGLNFAPFTKDRISSNPFKQVSELNGRNLARVDLTWENSNPRIIKPGMPCKYVFVKNDKIVSLKGTIVQHETLTTHQGSGIYQSTYRSVSHLVLLVERYTETKTTSDIAIQGDF